MNIHLNQLNFVPTNYVMHAPMVLYRVAQKKTSRTLRNYNGTYTLRGKISFGTFVDQYALLLTYKFQWRH